jgi:prepilin-type N-terminal cleavage/methylation domain-containing protein
MTPMKNRSRSGAAAGFTLVELMIVIVIIALLVGIVVPSIAAARVSAKVAATKTLIATLDSGVRMFQTEEAFGRDYPPSYAKAINGTGSDDLYGAQTMALAVLGHDLQGTRGFVSGSPPTYNFGTIASPNPDPRKGPYVDAGKLQIVPASGLQGPVILDLFKQPVLYYKANISQTAFARYTRTDNKPAIDGGLTFGWGADANFNDFINDPRMQTLNVTAGPYNPDSFLLISAGPDGQYGTGDDVTNVGVKK